MTALAWDGVGERFYQTGIDRGVLYLKDGTAVAWNGLTSVEEGSNTELKTYYMDGIKFLEHATPGEYVGKLQAITYPDEFNVALGVINASNGFNLHDQQPQKFDLSYRTRIGNDLDDTDYGYKIHILYNLLAVPDSHTFESINNQGSAGEFSWSLTGTPDLFHNFRPCMHVSIDSTQTPSPLLQEFEDILYGTVSDDPRLPDIVEVGSMFGAFGALIITDNGDGTWTADDSTDSYITMVTPTQFQIDNADATYLDSDTYNISSTNL